MKTTKMSLANIQGKLSRMEMKKIMAGSSDQCWDKPCISDTECAMCSGTTTWQYRCVNWHCKHG